MIFPVKQNALKRLFIGFNVVVYIATLIFSTLIFVAPKAQAASIYDEAYQTTGSFFASTSACGAAGVGGSDLYDDWSESQFERINNAAASYNNGTGVRFASMSWNKQLNTTTPTLWYTGDGVEGATLQWTSYEEPHLSAGYQAVSVAANNTAPIPANTFVGVQFVFDSSCKLRAQFVARSASTPVLISNNEPTSGDNIWGPSAVKNVYVSGNVDYNYPVGYTGTRIVENIEDVDVIAYPHVSYTILDKEITLNYLNNMPYDGPNECQEVTYRFYDDVGKEVNVARTGYDKPIDDTVAYTYGSYGTKSVSIEWHNFNNAGCPEVDFIERSTSIINFELDGSAQSGDNLPTNENCDILGTCKIPTEIRDCTVYNPITDMGEFIICWIQNINATFRSWFISLFIPKDLGTKLNRLMDNFTNQLGFIAFPFTYLADFYKKIAEDNVSACSTSGCVRNFGSFFGEDVTIDFATLHHVSPTAWNTLTGIARGMIVFFLVLGLVNKYKEVTHK